MDKITSLYWIAKVPNQGSIVDSDEGSEMSTDTYNQKIEGKKKIAYLY